MKWRRRTSIWKKERRWGRFCLTWGRERRSEREMEISCSNGSISGPQSNHCCFFFIKRNVHHHQHYALPQMLVLYFTQIPFWHVLAKFVKLWNCSRFERHLYKGEASFSCFWRYKTFFQTVVTTSYRQAKLIYQLGSNHHHHHPLIFLSKF